MKITMVFILCVLTFGGLVSCGDDTTELRWKNDKGNYVSDIRWLNTFDEIDERWLPQLNDGETSDFKDVSVITGHGVCLDDSLTEADIEVPGSSPSENYATSLSEGESNTLTILSTAKK